MPENCEEFTSLTQKDEGFEETLKKNACRNLDIPVKSSTGKPARNRKTKIACIVEADESTRRPKYHEDHIEGRGITNSLNLHDLFHIFSYAQSFIDGHLSYQAVVVGTTISKNKGRVVLRDVTVRDDSGSHAVFTEQGSSASQMTASKIMEIISRLPGCAGQAADAVSAYTQVKMEDAPELLKIPRSECPDNWIRLPRHKCLKIMVQYGRPSRSS